MGWREAVAGIVEELSCEDRMTRWRATGSSFERACRFQLFLHLMPEIRIDDCWVLTRKGLLPMADKAGIGRVGEYVVEVGSRR